MSKIKKVYNIFKDKKNQRLSFDEIQKIQQELKQNDLIIDDYFSKGVKFDDFMGILDNTKGNFEWVIVERYISNDPFVDRKRVVAKILGTCQIFKDDPEKWNCINGLKLKLIDSNIWHYSTPSENWMEIEGEKLDY